jgi:hypothetical protein
MKSYMKTGCCILFVFGMLLIISCGGSNNPSAKTAQEFVQKYSQAYKDENVGTIAKMTVPDKDQTEELFKDETKKDIKSKGFGYTAWTRTRYLSEEDRGKYIRVNVEIRGARSSIVLVKQEGLLKLVLNPSDYE